MAAAQIAIVTGPTSGIGRAIARRLAADGWAVIGVGRSADRLAAAGVDFAATVVCDLADPVAAAAAFGQIELAGVATAVLVNNAGAIAPIGRFDALDAATTARTMAVNATTPLLLSGLFARALAGQPQARGAIVQIGSGAAGGVIAGWTVYCASKAALHHGTRVIAAEADPARLRVFVLSPGVVETPMQAAIRAASADAMPGVAAFRDMHRDGRLADVGKPADWLADHLARWDLPHGEVVDLFSA